MRRAIEKPALKPATIPIEDQSVAAESAGVGVRARPAAVSRLSLTDFRCYAQARLDCDPRSVVLVGPNGAGKTNLLEALSFLSACR